MFSRPRAGRQASICAVLALLLVPRLHSQVRATSERERCDGTADTLTLDGAVKLLSEGRASWVSADLRTRTFSIGQDLVLSVGSAPDVNDAVFVGVTISSCLVRGGWRSTGWPLGNTDRQRRRWNEIVTGWPLTVTDTTSALAAGMAALSFVVGEVFTGPSALVDSTAGIWSRLRRLRVNSVLASSCGWYMRGDIEDGPQFAIEVASDGEVCELTLWN